MNREAFHRTLFQGEQLVQPRVETKFQVVVNYPEGVNEADRELLGKILKSISIELSEVEMINLSKEKWTPEGQSNTTTLHFAGYEVIENYSPLRDGSNVIIASDDLSTLAQDTNLKMKLWNALKEL